MNADAKQRPSLGIHGLRSLFEERFSIPALVVSGASSRRKRLIVGAEAVRSASIIQSRSLLVGKMNKSQTSTSRASASLISVFNDGLPLPRNISDACPLEKSVSR